MTHYPPQPGFPQVPHGVPADETGVYPALAGYTPMETGRRVVVALADGGIMLAAYVLVAILAVLNENLAILGTLVMLAAAAAQLWAIVMKSSRLAGLFLKATYVDVHTGQRAGGKVFVKFLIQGAVAGFTFGIGALIIVLVSVKEPLKRNWFDRVSGVMLVDERTGRPVSAPVTAANPYPASPPAPVAPAQAGPLHTPAVSPVAPVAPVSPPAPVPPSPSAFAPVQPPVAPAPPAYTPPAPPSAPLTQVGIITSVPGAPPAAPDPAPASVYAPPAWGSPAESVVVERQRSGSAPDAEEHTVLAPDSALMGSPTAWLDGVRLALTPATVIGRDPVAPGSHPDAVPYAVRDLQVSKTHLLLGQDDEGPYVIDLHSTNGVAVAKQPDAPKGRIEAGRRIRLASGATVHLGQSVVEIRA